MLDRASLNVYDTGPRMLDRASLNVYDIGPECWIGLL